MSNALPNSHNNSPTSSIKEINFGTDQNLKFPDLPKVNQSLFSKSAVVFKPSPIKISSNDSQLNGQQKKMSPARKNNPNLHMLSTRFGSLIFPDQNQTKKNVISKQKKSEVQQIAKQEIISTQKNKISLSSIAENPTSENIEYIFKKPVFLRALVSEGKINQKYINTILQNISKDDLYFFMNTMTTELTLHSSLAASYTLTEIEKNLSRILSFKKVLVWYKPYNSNFLISPTLREIVPINRSIVGYCAIKQKKIITDDPAMCSGFDIDYDLPILRGSESMALFPVISDYGDVAGVVQFVDLQSKDQSTILSISKYEQSLLKLAVKITKRQIFREDDSYIYVPREIINLLLFCGSGKKSSAIMTTASLSIDKDKERPSTSYLPIKNGNRGKSFSSFAQTSPLKTEISENKFALSSDSQSEGKRKLSANDFIVDDNYFYRVSFNFENVIANMISFMKKYFDCEGVDIFEFDSDKKAFTRLVDGTLFSETTVGLSFLPIIKDEPVFVANGLQMGFPRSQLDRKFSNNSALTVAYKYRYKVLEEQKENISRSTLIKNDQSNKNSGTLDKNSTLTDENQSNPKVDDIEIIEDSKSNDKVAKSNELTEKQSKKSSIIQEEAKSNSIQSSNGEIKKTNIIDNDDVNDSEFNVDICNSANNDNNDPSLESSHFVFTLRSKWMMPSFLPDDLKKLNDISMILCACIHNIQINRSKNHEIKILQRENFLIQVLGNALTSYMDHKYDKWTILRKAAKEIYGASNCFVCSFDGMMIHFHPTEVTCKFDQCIAGKAFNFQELTEFVPTRKEENDKKDQEKDEKHVCFSFDDQKKKVEESDNDEEESDMEIYKKLGVSENLKRASAFHFLFDGKVKGSIEVINPTYPEIDQAGQKIMGIICSITNPF